MVIALDSGSRGSGSSPGRAIVMCSWARHFTLSVPLSTQEYKWVPANCQGNLTKCWGVTCNGLASHPGGVAIFLVASCYRNREKLRQSWATKLVRLNLCSLCLQMTPAVNVLKPKFDEFASSTTISFIIDINGPTKLQMYNV